MAQTALPLPRQPLRDRWRSAPRRHRLLATFGALALALVVAMLLFDWNMLKHPIERRVSAATGREFQIDGDLSVKLGLKPRITMDGLRWTTGRCVARALQQSFHRNIAIARGQHVQPLCELDDRKARSG